MYNIDSNGNTYIANGNASGMVGLLTERSGHNTTTGLFKKDNSEYDLEYMAKVLRSMSDKYDEYFANGEHRIGYLDKMGGLIGIDHTGIGYITSRACVFLQNGENTSFGFSLLMYSNAVEKTFLLRDEFLRAEYHEYFNIKVGDSSFSIIGDIFKVGNRYYQNAENGYFESAADAVLVDGRLQENLHGAPYNKNVGYNILPDGTIISGQKKDEFQLLLKQYYKLYDIEYSDRGQGVDDDKWNEFVSLRDAIYTDITNDNFSLITRRINMLKTITNDEVKTLSFENGSSDTITYGLDNLTYEFVLSGTASANIEIVSNDPSLVINGNILTISKSGTFTFVAISYGDDNSCYAISQDFTLTINKGSVEDFSITSNNTLTYNDKDYILTISNDELDVNYSITGGTGIGIIIGNKLRISKAGTFEISAVVEENELFYSATDSFVLTVYKGEQSEFRISSADEIDFGDSYTAVASGGLVEGATIAYYIGNTGTGEATINPITGALTITRAGTIEILSTITGDLLYNNASTSFMLTVNKAAQRELVFTSENNILAHESYTALVSGGSGIGAITYSIIGGTGEGSITSSGILTVTKIGTIIIKAIKVGGDNYLDASAEMTLTVSKGEQAALVIESDLTIKFGDEYTALVSGGSGTGAITYSIIGGTGEGSITSSGTLTVTKIGTIIIKAIKVGGDNYLDASVEMTLTVSKGEQPALNINSPNTATVGKNYIIAYSGGLSGMPASYEIISGTGEATVSTNGVVNITKAGTFTIKIKINGNDNYNAIEAELTVTASEDDSDLQAIAGCGTISNDNFNNMYFLLIFAIFAAIILLKRKFLNVKTIS